MAIAGRICWPDGHWLLPKLLLFTKREILAIVSTALFMVIIFCNILYSSGQSHFLFKCTVEIIGKKFNSNRVRVNCCKS